MTVELTTEEREQVIQAFALAFGAMMGNDPANSSRILMETVERILAARAAAPDALRVAVEALAAESRLTDALMAHWAATWTEVRPEFAADTVTAVLRALLDDPALAGRATGGEG